MALFVLISWIKFVRQQFLWILAIIMSFIAQNASKSLLNSWNLMGSLSQPILTRIAWLLCLILCLGLMIQIERSFVGVRGELNCILFKTYDRVAKKNTQIWRLSVLSLVCYYKCYTDWILINPILAHRINKINFFARCYV